MDRAKSAAQRQKSVNGRFDQQRLSMATRNRKLLGNGIATAIVAVLGVAFVVAAIVWFVANDRPHTTWQWISPFAFGLFVAFLALGPTVFSLILVGLPLFSVWARNGYQTVRGYLLAGTLLSVVVLMFLFLEQRLIGALDGRLEKAIAIATILIGGPIAALTVRHVVISARPVRQRETDSKIQS